jgi:hypothetical protein
LKRLVTPTEAQRRRADLPAPGLAVVNDATVVDVHPGPKLVGEAEAVGFLQLVDVG